MHDTCGLAGDFSRRFLAAGLVALVAYGTFDSPAARADVDAQQVRQAMDRAIAYLRRQQKPDGSWKPHTAFVGGETSLCALGMMEAGVDPKDPAVRKALDYIRSTTPERTYTVALQTMALARAGEKADLATIRRNVQFLERTQQRSGKNAGGWGYPTLIAGDSVDNSNTQFALLGLHEAERAGVEVNKDTWKQALLYWERTKNGRGSWGYVPNRPSTGSMTSAGISSLIIASGNASGEDARADASGCRCTGHVSQETLENALEWLGNNISVRRNVVAGRLLGVDEGSQLDQRYYLYSLERAGRLSGRRFFIGSGRDAVPYDWYREGADLLVHSQDAAGFWTGKGRGEEDLPHIPTAMCLLFLSKGRRPVLISKLQRPGDDWNLLRHDLANLTSYVEQKWDLPLNWQIINSRAATLSDYYQTPVLYLSGRDAIRFHDEAQKQLLRAYVEEGGFIFADACCDGAAFEQSFRQLMHEIFPEPQLQLKPLEPDHPIWTMEEKIDPKYLDPNKRWLFGIDVGCRTSVVLSNGNLSCYWELARPRRFEPLMPEVDAEMRACRAIGVNVLAYATNRQLKPKDAIPRKIETKDSKTESPRGQLAVAKLRHAGGCDDAPRALSNLMESLAAAYQIRADKQAPLLEITDPSLFNFHLVFLQGRNDFRLDPKEVLQLRTFIERGGTVFADSICANPAFAEAFRREMAKVLPGQSMRQIPVADPLFSAAYGGQDITKVTRREAIRHRQGEPLEIKLRENVEPVLEGMKKGQRYAIIFSPYDISCALERHAAPQCRGYTPDDAARIAINVILYSLHD